MFCVVYGIDISLYAVSTRKKLKINRVSSQILWSASLVLSNTIRLVVKSVVEIKVSLELGEGAEKTRVASLG